MKLLILGGTVFVGRHLADAALRRGHSVTLFHRGKHNPGLFSDSVETVTGDRTDPDDLARLAGGRTWDAVVDTCGYVPRVVRMAGDALRDCVRTYCFVSTIAVYSDWSAPTLTEGSPLATLADETVEEVVGETYGGLKVLCENAIREIYGAARTLITRPGFIVGPHDPTDRFTYWVHRVAAGGDVLAPGDHATSAQFIDARDLSEWNLRLLESGASGTFNADGYPVTLGELLPLCRAAAGRTESDTRFVYVPQTFLDAHGLTPGVSLPIFAPKEPDEAAIVDVSRAVVSGLAFRPLADTVADTLAWDRIRTDEGYLRAVARDKEAAILAAFAAEK